MCFPVWSNRLRIAGIALAALALPAWAAAHCDGMDGPVVKAAQAALAAGDVRLILIWVAPAAEAEVRRSFEQVSAVRKLGPEARALADRQFFETVVRLHRTAEGASYTGVAEAGRDLGPAIPLADRALETGDPEPLLKLLGDELRRNLLEQFERARAAKSRAGEGVGAGREFVHAYVGYVHFAERAHQALGQAAGGHFDEHAPAAHATPE